MVDLFGLREAPLPRLRDVLINHLLRSQVFARLRFINPILRIPALITLARAIVQKLDAV